MGRGDRETSQTICWRHSYSIEVSGLVSFQFQKASFTWEVFHNWNSGTH